MNNLEDHLEHTRRALDKEHLHPHEEHHDTIIEMLCNTYRTQLALYKKAHGIDSIWYAHYRQYIYNKRQQQGT